jgi:tRNA-dihydrouridine synthase C
VARILDVVQIPVTANGEVWTTADYARCRSVSGSTDVMIGRGAVADPFLALRIRALLAGEGVAEARSDDWQALLPLLADYWRQVQLKVEPRHAPGRLKLWLGALRRTFIEAETLYLAVRTLRSVDETTQALRAHGLPVSPVLRVAA